MSTFGRSFVAPVLLAVTCGLFAWAGVAVNAAPTAPAQADRGWCC